MALFTLVLRWTQVVHGSWYRPRVGVERDGEQLARSREFRLYVPGCSCPHMAFHTGHARVRRELVCGEFGMHHAVAKLAAELYGIRELVSLITAYHAQSDEDDDKTQKKGKCSSLTGIVEIDSQITRSFSGELQASAAPLEQDSTHDQSQSYNQKSRSHHVGQDADIGTGVL